MIEQTYLESKNYSPFLPHLHTGVRGLPPRAWEACGIRLFNARVDYVACSACDRVIYDGIEWLLGQVEGYDMRGECMLRLYNCVAMTTGVQKKIWICQPGQELVQFKPTDHRGLYEYCEGMRCFAKPCMSRVEVEDPTTLELRMNRHKTGGLRRLYFNARLFGHTILEGFRNCCCWTLPDEYYISEDVYVEIVEQGMICMADSLSERNMRSCVRLCVKKFPGINTDTIRATIWAALYQEQIVVNQPERVDLTQELVPREQIQITQGEYSVEPSGFMFETDVHVAALPMFVNNGMLVLKNASGVTFGETGLKFTNEYFESTSYYLVGPHIQSATLMYEPRSTEVAAAAFYRISNSRQSERMYRCFQDLLYSHMWGVNTPRYSRECREMAKRYKCFGAWGLPYNGINRFYESLKPQERQETWLLSVACRKWFCALVQAMKLGDNFDTYMKLVEARFRMRMDMNQEYAEIPMPKRQLRLKAVQDLWDNPNYLHLYKHVLPALKVKWEIAKHGKVPRQFVSLGDLATMYSPYIPDLLKKLRNLPVTMRLPIRTNEFMTPIHKPELTIDFVATPEPGRLDRCFDAHASMHAMPPCTAIRALVHSDDSLITFHCRIGGVWCVVSALCDIAKCDLSHGPCVFGNLEIIARELDLTVDALVQQCMSDLILNHPNPQSEDFAIFGVNNPILLSGSTLTTIINTMAVDTNMVAIAMGLAMRRDFITIEELDVYLHMWVAYTGYEITAEYVVTTRDVSKPIMDKCDLRLEKITFLKFFPAWCDETQSFIAVPALGRLLRSYGLSDEKVDCHSFCSNVLRTFLTCHTSNMLNNVCVLALGKEHMTLPLVAPEPQFVYSLGCCDERKTFNDEAFARRYGVTVADLNLAMELMFCKLTPRMIRSPVLMSVLAFDYGLCE